MNRDAKIKQYVVPPYHTARTFYHSQTYFWAAREHFYELVKQERPRSILDVGCGHALDSKALMELVERYVGIDPIEGNLERARKDNPKGTFRVGFMQDTGYRDEEFDWVWSSTVWDILPTADEMERGILECLRVAKHRVFSMDCTAKPRLMAERYMMVPMQFRLSIERVNYNPEKQKANYLWTIDKSLLPTVSARRESDDEVVHTRN